MTTSLSHLNADGQPTMVDVAHKQATQREATARAELILPDALAQHIQDRDLQSAKGPVFHTAIIAGTQAVKRTAELIPFCHPLPIDGCTFTLEIINQRVIIDCRVKVFHKTGVEMEALTGASIAALTIYDMCKAVSQDIVITNTRLLKKSGGQHDIDKT